MDEEKKDDDKKPEEHENNDKNNLGDDIDEEELKRIIEDLTKQKNGIVHKQTKFTFQIHNNFGINFLVTYIVNLLCVAVLIGFSFGVFLETSLLGFFLAITIFTFLEIMFKTIIFRYFFKLILYSLGIILYLLQVLIFVPLHFLIPDFSFAGVWEIFVFTALFLIIRIGVVFLVKKIMFNLPVRRKGKK